MGFLANLVQVFPGLAKRPLYLTGESYAGASVFFDGPYILYAILFCTFRSLVHIVIRDMSLICPLVYKSLGVYIPYIAKVRPFLSPPTFVGINDIFCRSSFCFDLICSVVCSLRSVILRSSPHLTSPHVRFLQTYFSTPNPPVRIAKIAMSDGSYGLDETDILPGVVRLPPFFFPFLTSFIILSFALVLASGYEDVPTAYRL